MYTMKARLLSLCINFIFLNILFILFSLEFSHGIEISSIYSPFHHTHFLSSKVLSSSKNTLVSAQSHPINSFLGKYLFIDGNFMYVSLDGIAKWFPDSETWDVSTQTNGCPPKSDIFSLQLPWKEEYEYPNAIIPTVPPLTTGIPMVWGQMCDLEIYNVYASRYLASSSYVCTVNSYLINGNFTTPALASNSYTYYLGTTVTGWYFFNSALLSSSVDWGYPIPYPNGYQSVSIQRRSYIYQLITFSIEINYTISFSACGRSYGTSANTLNIRLYNSVNKVYTSLLSFTPPTTQWKTYSTWFTVSATQSYALNISGTSSQDISSAITDLKLSYICIHPSSQPTSQPTRQPTAQPTKDPTLQPTSRPTIKPSTQPTRVPTSQPSSQPTLQPTLQPTSQPTRQPLAIPTAQPSSQPTCQPSSQPTTQPTNQPSTQPTNQPSSHPTSQPSSKPSCNPSSQPTNQPTLQPTSQPSDQPSNKPTTRPTNKPTVQPSTIPSSQPSSFPSSKPTDQPSVQPSSQPSNQPTLVPTAQPSSFPSIQPTNQPSGQPSNQPTSQPSNDPSSQPTTLPSLVPSSQPSSQPSNQPSSQPSSQPTGQPSKQPSSQPSSLPTVQPSVHPSNQPSSQPSGQPSSQPTSQPSNQPSNQPSSQPSENPSSLPSTFPSNRPTNVPTSKPSLFPTSQPTSSPSSQPTLQPSGTPSTTPSSIPTISPTKQPSAQPSSFPSSQPTSQPSLKPTSQPSCYPTFIPSALPSGIPTGFPSSLPTSFPSVKPTIVPSSMPTNPPSSQPTTKPSNRPSVAPSSCPSLIPSNQPTMAPSSQPSIFPTNQPSSIPTTQPSNQPTVRPSSPPTGKPTSSPSSSPTGNPSSQPTIFPTTCPSGFPTSNPSSIPSTQPSNIPTSQPSLSPTYQPSSQPTSTPSNQPIGLPTYIPSSIPSLLPTVIPTTIPTDSPSNKPTNQPSAQPISLPSTEPSSQPTSQPTSQSTSQPTSLPTCQPSRLPTSQPSGIPSTQPSSQPSNHPSQQPTSQPSLDPTSQPTIHPTCQPTGQPTVQPSLQPTRQPTSQPTEQPSSLPSLQPTSQPSNQPSKQPSSQPTSQPSSKPTVQPSVQPTNQPTGQPSSQPSGKPTSQPSSKPTEKPSSQPTSQPTNPSSQPTSRPTSPTSIPTSHPTNPTSQPSGQPSRQPSSQPSSQPTCQPTKRPSSQPTRKPTSQPSTQPSNRPSSQPSTQPSRQPTSQPTSRPSRQPTTQPSSQPTTQPSKKPTSQPTSQPSRQPTSQPVSHPTSAPTRQPSSQPTAQPFSHPSSVPTSMPTIDGGNCPLNTFYYPPENRCKSCQANSKTYKKGAMSCSCNAGYKQYGEANTLTCESCPAGYSSNIGDTFCSICRKGTYTSEPGIGKCIECNSGYIASLPGATSCTACEPGDYAATKGSSECIQCSKGYYSNNYASSVCSICDQGMYNPSKGATSCRSCQPGAVTPGFGSTTFDDCVSPQLNFIAGYISFFLAAALAFIYIVFGRFEKLSFDRKEKYVQPNILKCLQLNNTLKEDIFKLMKTDYQSNLRSSQKVQLFVISLFGYIFVFVFVSFFWIFNNIFVNLLIVARGLHLNLSSLFSQFEHFFLTVFQLLQSSGLIYLFYPFFLIYTIFSSININSLYHLVTVTCQGAKSPIELFIDCVVIGITIAFLKSNLLLLWAISLQDVNRSIAFKAWNQHRKLLHPQVILFLLAYIITTMNPFLIILRYFLSMVNITSFFRVYYVMHDISLACVDVQGFEGQELILVYATSLLIWLLLYPMLYMLAEIVCPAGGREYLHNNRITHEPTAVTRINQPSENKLISQGNDENIAEITGDNHILIPEDEDSSSNFSVQPRLSFSSNEQLHQNQQQPDVLFLNTASPTNIDIEAQILHSFLSKNNSVDDISQSLNNYSNNNHNNDHNNKQLNDQAIRTVELSFPLRTPLQTPSNHIIRITWVDYLTYFASMSFALDLWIAYGIEKWIKHLEKLQNIEKKLAQRSNQRWKAFPQATQQEFLAFLPQKQTWSSRWKYYQQYLTQKVSENKNIQWKWKQNHHIIQQNQPHLPKYHSLCQLECQEIVSHWEKSGWLLGIPWFLRVICGYLLVVLCVGHVFTRTGRRHLLCIIRKYYLFACVCMGYWTDEAYEAYELNVLTASLSNESKEESMDRLLPLIVSSRAILLQALGPAFTLISVLIISQCGSPLFNYSKQLTHILPPLICWNAYADAYDKENTLFQQQSTQPTDVHSNEAYQTSDRQIQYWAVHILTIHIFITKSRLFVFFASFFSVSLLYLIVYQPPGYMWLMYLLLCILIPYFLCFGLRVLIAIGKIIDVKDEDLLQNNCGWLFGITSSLVFRNKIVPKDDNYGLSSSSSEEDTSDQEIEHNYEYLYDEINENNLFDLTDERNQKDDNLLSDSLRFESHSSHYLLTSSSSSSSSSSHQSFTNSDLHNDLKSQTNSDIHSEIADELSENISDVLLPSLSSSSLNNNNILRLSQRSFSFDSSMLLSSFSPNNSYKNSQHNSQYNSRHNSRHNSRNNSRNNSFFRSNSHSNSRKNSQISHNLHSDSRLHSVSRSVSRSTSRTHSRSNSLSLHRLQSNSNPTLVISPSLSRSQSNVLKKSDENILNNNRNEFDNDSFDSYHLLSNNQQNSKSIETNEETEIN